MSAVLAQRRLATRVEYTKRAGDRWASALRKIPLGNAIVYPDPDDVAQGAVNHSAAKAALTLVRELLHSPEMGGKSTNKWSSHQETPPRERMSRSFPFTIGIENPSAEANLAKSDCEVWAGYHCNCAALAIAAQHVVAQQEPTIQTSLVELTVDHVFAVIGSVRPELVCLPIQEWPAHLFICDPWANICCPAPDYPDRFKEKMAKWGRGGKRILSAEQEWVAPDRPGWLLGAHRASRIIVEQRYESSVEKGRRTQRGYVPKSAPEAKESLCSIDPLRPAQRQDATVRSTGDPS